MHKWLVLAAAMMFAAVTVQGSTIEDQTTQVHPALVYQEDAHVPGDAPGTCETVDDRRIITSDEDTHGILVDPDDVSDAFVAHVAPESVGQVVALDVIIGDIRATGIEFDVDVRASDCSYSVFDPEAPVYQGSDDRPTQSFEPGEGEQLATTTTFTDYACNEDQWKVHMNRLVDGSAPSQVYMEWTDGSWEYVNLHHRSQGTVAMYLHGDHTDVTLAKIEAVVPADWDGTLKIAHGPCEAQDGEIQQPPEVGEKYGLMTEWTAVDDSYIVIVSISKGLQDVAEENAQMVVDTVTDPPTSMPMQCHHICTAFVGDMAYLLEFRDQTR